MQEVLQAVREFTAANGGRIFTNTPPVSPALPRHLSRSRSVSCSSGESGFSDEEFRVWSSGMIGPVSDIAMSTRQGYSIR